MKRYFLLVIVLFVKITHGQQSAPRHIIKGTVTNSTGKKMSGVQIKILSTGESFSTDAEGLYFINASKGDYLVGFSFSDYVSREVFISLDRDTMLNIVLESPYGGLRLDDVVINGSMDRVSNPHSGLSVMDFTTVEKIPAFLGEKDIIRSLQLMPGVVAASEASTEMNVRGGSSDQNLILLDNIPLYSSSHLFGMYSSFNPLVVESASLYTGAFPAFYGGKISSVTDVATRTANMKELRGTAELGLTSAKFAFEVPLVKNRASLLLAGRRTFYDIYSRITSAGDFEDFNFYDFNGILDYRVNDKNVIKLSTYLEGDQFRSKTGEIDHLTSGMKKGQRAVSFNWKNFAGDSFNQDVSLSYNTYLDNLSERRFVRDLDGFYDQYFDSKVRDLSARYTFGARAAPFLEIKGGLDFVNHNLQPGKFSGSEDGVPFSFSSLPGSKINEISAFAGAIVHLKNKQLDIALRHNLFMNPVKQFSSFEPRISYFHPIGRRFSIKAAYSRMSQPIQRLVNPGLGMPLDILFPADKIIHPQRADIFSAGFSRDFKVDDELFTFSVEGYYKKMENILSFRDGYDTRSVIYNAYGGGYSASNVHDILVSGSGKSMGLDLLLEKKAGDLTGWISYSWIMARNRFSELNNGKTFRSPQDRPHVLNAVLNWQMNERWSMGTTWMYASGQPVNIPEAVYQSPRPTLDNNLTDFNYYFLYAYGERNSHRMKSFHKLDISFSYRFDLGDLSAKLNIGIYNLYNRANSSFYYLGKSLDEQTKSDKPVLKSVSMFTAMPAVSLKVDF